MRVSCFALSVALSAAACGGHSPTSPSSDSSSTSSQSPTNPAGSATPAGTILDMGASVGAGSRFRCNVGALSGDVPGSAGMRITITADGTESVPPGTLARGLNIRVTLFAPDFTTPLAEVTGTGAAVLTSILLTQTGAYRASICEVDGLAGFIHLRVKQD